ncbi:restriction endonuclease subunit S [Coraliomargarita algicola]|uniref:Restriction endonuclease subunit S n=1 Tax=Coraliomargarita algicola TaxID=3092156 RepID=A0ABZ0RGS5_9BACT|nr:restriction endonuclease subunit S [Coraliomargarita sp. J2-16]WPJ95237.1 restriction endonuclease subunit S [Coraliomargarita sp. J2-16]
MPTNNKVAGALDRHSPKGDGCSSSRVGSANALVPELRFPEFSTGEDWQEQKAGSLFANRTEKGVSKLPIYSVTMNDGMVRRSSLDRNFDDIASAGNKRVYKNDIAYNMMRMWQGAFGLAPENCLVSPAYIVLSSQKTICTEFFGYLFKSRKYLQLFTSHSRGLTEDRLRLYYPDFAVIPLQFPSLPEQQKIADCLGSLDDLIAAHSRKLAALQDHKKGLLQQLFPAEGETTPKLRFPPFAGEWTATTLVKACQMKAGKFVRAAEINNSPKDALYPCYGGNGLRGYTKTYTHDGKYSLIGRQGALCGNVQLTSGRFHATEHAVVANPTKEVCSDWLFYALSFLNLNQFATGQAQPGLSVEVLERVSIAIPTNTKEQQKIADCLSDLDALIAAQTKQIAALKAHKQGLMQQLYPCN